MYPICKTFVLNIHLYELTEIPKILICLFCGSCLQCPSSAYYWLQTEGICQPTLITAPTIKRTRNVFKKRENQVNKLN